MSCGCGCSESKERAGEIKSTISQWKWSDRLGEIMVRLGPGRMNYRVVPGLYALGRPNQESAVFVTANYKLSFDHDRRALAGIDAWILVLDTHGVNVWCAAGKGTFSTDELCRQIEITKLPQVVKHRRLILPQLGAVGVAAHQVAKRTGFTVVYGPVRAADIPLWLQNGRRKDTAMRRVNFDFVDRLILAPVEISNAGWHILGLLSFAFVLALIGVRGLNQALVITFSGYALLLAGLVLTSGLLVPALLPWLPTRSFSIKGAVVGAGWVAILALLAGLSGESRFWYFVHDGWAIVGATLFCTALAAFAGLNFTGASTFTSQSGTLLETRKALPVIGTSAVAGAVIQIISAI